MYCKSIGNSEVQFLLCGACKFRLNGNRTYPELHQNQQAIISKLCNGTPSILETMSSYNCRLVEASRTQRSASLSLRSVLTRSCHSLCPRSTGRAFPL